MANEEKIVNKIVPIETIIEIANYFENQKEEYNRLFELDKKKNQNLSYSEQRYEYKGDNPKVQYTIRFKDGREVTEQGYNWFIGMISNLSVVEEITIYSNISYSANYREQNNYEYMLLSTWIHFWEDKVILRVDGRNVEEQVYKVHSYLRGAVEKNEDRYNKTVKNRKARIQAFSFSVGIILSYLVYVILLINKTKLPEYLSNYLDNKFVLIIGQWFVAGLLGNILGFPIMTALYKNIIPKAKYSHYSRQSHKSVYVDNIEDYTSHDEVQIGKFTNNGKNRENIEKIYKVTSKIVLVQLAISILFFLFIK
ncbi:MAG: hypothetical protein HFJ59_00585 [Clostridia bacterium]|nr:hypothetical protein [Clostridia bacterium]